MKIILFFVYIIDYTLCSYKPNNDNYLEVASNKIASKLEQNIIKDDYFECVKTSKNFTLLPNNEKNYVFIAANHTSTKYININQKMIPQDMIKMTDISYLNIMPPSEKKPICFCIYYSKDIYLQLEVEKEYTFYALSYNSSYEYQYEFELTNLEINLTYIGEITTKNNEAYFGIKIYKNFDKERNVWMNLEKFSYYGDIEIIKFNPLAEKNLIVIKPYLHHNQYDEIKIKIYIDLREKNKGLVTAAITLFYIGLIFIVFFFFIGICNSLGSGTTEDSCNSFFAESIEICLDRFLFCLTWPFKICALNKNS